MRLIFVLFLAGALCACSKPAPAPEPATPEDGADAAAAPGAPSPFASGPCSNEGGIETYCGFTNPEDIVVSPDGALLIVSEMGEFMTDAAGTLSVFDPATGTRSPLALSFRLAGNGWGDATCPAPEGDRFSPHGIDLRTLPDGSHRLLVVNHGGREAVEMFELTDDSGTWRAAWKGCALPPGDPFINDVAALADGGFLVTHMWDKQTSFDEVGRKLTSGEPTGWVWRWSPGKGFEQVDGSLEMMPNGIVVSPDDRFAFVNIYMGNKTVKLDLSGGGNVGEFEVRQPDNITMDSDGNLWVASHQHDPLNETCAGVEHAACLLPFRIVKANPDTLATEVVLDQRGEPMGYATVATHVGDRVWLGSAHGDRIAVFADGDTQGP